jgi:hypothetical protein
MMQSDDELTPEERDALSRLPRAAAPPPGLEQATVALLAARGLLRPPGRRFRAVLALAASVLVFVGGMMVGRFGTTSAPTEPEDQRPRFVLFLYEGPEYDQPPPGAMDERVREYSAWAGEERREGTVEGGEKLKDGDDVVIGAGEAPGAEEFRLAGYFLIRAADQGSALAIARSCPHVRYGGSIVLREIDPT